MNDDSSYSFYIQKALNIQSEKFYTDKFIYLKDIKMELFKIM